ncbi:hypothetical protein GCM10007884_06650 [Methylobacterium brachythecii]|uniref:HAD family hydrolase n=2 Tax=Methylobacterium brachythecii TaxID=1176177 RepID=A0ABQ6CXV9_9HYPH|nr:hypothetical protein GCM10007884_06650 [Methylobacterium brachythecii]
MFACVSDTTTTISCDVFDTLLHRDDRAESSRFRTIAELVSQRLVGEHCVAIDPRLVWRTRIGVQRAAYRAVELATPDGDVRFADLVAVTATILGLEGRQAAILREAELAVERQQLRPNRPFLTWLAEQARAGRRVVAASDTYHDGATIEHLLDTLAPGHPVAAIYTSADLGATKRSGALFPALLRAEGVRADQVLHIGDDALADVAMASAAGLKTLHLVRPRHIRIRRKADAVRARVERVLSHRNGFLWSRGAALT